MYRGAKTTTLLGGRGGKGEKLRQMVLIVLRILSSIVDLQLRRDFKESKTSCLLS